MFCRLLKIFSKIDINETQPSVEEFNKICKNNSEYSDPEMIRNNEFLQWRFRDAPLWKAIILHIYKNKSYHGYIVTRKINLERLVFFVIMDYSLSDELSKFDLNSIRWHLIYQGINSESDIVFTMLNPNSKASYKILGFPFTKIPDSFLPHKTPIFIHANDTSFSNIAENGKLHITLGDLDYF